MAALVLDSSPLSCFARCGRLSLLDELTQGYDRITTKAVIHEIEKGTQLFIDS